jgi:hypothetical protein
MFRPRTQIRIRVKLFTGLHKEARLETYNPEAGIQMEIRNGARIRTVAKRLGLATSGQIAFFVAGQRASPWHKLKDGDELACMKPSAGG